MDPNIVSALIGLGGAVVGATIAWITARIYKQRENAVELYDFFSTREMEEVRNNASDLIRSNLAGPRLTFEQMHDEGLSKNTLTVSQLLHFWERASHLISDGYANDRLARKFLRHYFVRHYQVFLSGFCTLCETRPDPEEYRAWISAVRKLAIRWEVKA